MSVQNSLVLLNRVLTLKDGLPFVLVVDSLVQSSFFLVEEFAFKAGNDIIYLSFETVNKPAYATAFVDCMDKEVSSIIKEVAELQKDDSLSGGVGSQKKSLIIIDSLSFVPLDEVTVFISSLIQQSSVVLGVFHNDTETKSAKYPNFPNHLSVLNYIASSIFEVEPYDKTPYHDEQIDAELTRLKIPIVKQFNSPVFKVILTNRRKSGRASSYKFIINSSDHIYDIFKEQEQTVQEDESLLEDLTTFNLTTNVKQKLAREQVDLPYMEAQEKLGSFSGAIVYEFEKDDDYDEEDPYEDPF